MRVGLEMTGIKGGISKGIHMILKEISCGFMETYIQKIQIMVAY